MENLSVQRAIKNESELLSEISIESKMYWGYPEEWLKLWINDLKISPAYIENNHVYKLMIKNEIAGFIAIEEGNDISEITHLWVKPKYMGKGYGKKLLNDAISIVVKPGKEILVEADPNAEAFYSSQGFKTFDKKESLPRGRFLPLMKKLQK